ncbi:MAG: rod shape-determining protein RodA [Candidatus Cloacimonetes bacterium]|nr:rod shape-determining protein RodA [Candidatus Cloacimonadota bacterium]
MTTKFPLKIDWLLLIILVALILFGEMAIYSASIQKYGDKDVVSDYYIKQLIWIFIGAIVFVLVLYIPEILMDIFVVPFYIITILLLILVLFLPGISGVHRWINFGGFSLQPSELAKLSSILLIAKIISRQYLLKRKIVLYSFLVILLPVLLILKEPDLGSSLIFFAFILPMIYFAGVSFFTLLLIISPIISIIVGFSVFWWIVFDFILLIILLRKRFSYFFSGFIVVGNAFISLLTPYFWGFLKNYQQERILAFINPKHDFLGSGYQIIQSKIAIGSGGFFGKGFLNGTQKNLDFLPEQQTDFIFSVIGEELGFIGCFLLIIIFILLIWRGVFILKKLRNQTKRIAIIGILSFLIFQIVINIGMNIGIIPVVGIPLPFISYGGSSLIVNMAAVSLFFKYAKERSFI